MSQYQQYHEQWFDQVSIVSVPSLVGVLIENQSASIYLFQVINAKVCLIEK